MLLWLKLQPQGHLDLPRAADGILGNTEAAGTIEKTIRCCVRSLAAARRESGLTLNRERIEFTILREVVEWNVKTGCVREIENIERITKIPVFPQLHCLH